MSIAIRTFHDNANLVFHRINRAIRKIACCGKRFMVHWVSARPDRSSETASLILCTGEGRTSDDCRRKKIPIGLCRVFGESRRGREPALISARPCVFAAFAPIWRAGLVPRPLLSSERYLGSLLSRAADSPSPNRPWRKSAMVLVFGCTLPILEIDRPAFGDTDHAEPPGIYRRTAAKRVDKVASPPATILLSVIV